MFDGSLHSWEEWMLAALALAAFSAVAVVFTTQRVIKLTRIELEESKSRTEELRKQNLALEAKIAPRRLSLEQQADIASALSAFSDSGRIVRIVSYALDVEGLGLARQLAAVFERARIVHGDSFASVAAMDDNIIVGVNVRGRDKALVDAIATALETIGKTVVSRKEDETPGAAFRSAPILPDSAIAAFVFVGAKPIETIK